MITHKIELKRKKIIASLFDDKKRSVKLSFKITDLLIDNLLRKKFMDLLLPQLYSLFYQERYRYPCLFHLPPFMEFKPVVILAICNLFNDNLFPVFFCFFILIEFIFYKSRAYLKNNE